MYVRKTYQDWMNWPEYWKNLPKTKEFTGILGKLTRLLGILTKNIWISRNIGKTYQERIICQIIGNTYQEQLNLPEYWENLPRTNYLPDYWEYLPRTTEFTRILGKLTKNEWINRNIWIMLDRHLLPVLVILMQYTFRRNCSRKSK